MKTKEEFEEAAFRAGCHPDFMFPEADCLLGGSRAVDRAKLPMLRTDGKFQIEERSLWVGGWYGYGEGCAFSGRVIGWNMICSHNQTEAHIMLHRVVRKDPGGSARAARIGPLLRLDAGWPMLFTDSADRALELAHIVADHAVQQWNYVHVCSCEKEFMHMTESSA